MIEVTGGAGEVAGLGKRAEMQLVKDDLFPSAAAPVAVAPVIGLRIDNLARPVHTVGLPARGRIGISGAVDDIAIARARPGRRSRQTEPATRLLGHRNIGRVLALEAQRHRSRGWRPQAKADAAGLDFGAERQLMVAIHRRPPLVYPRRKNESRAAPRGRPPVERIPQHFRSGARLAAARVAARD